MTDWTHYFSHNEIACRCCGVLQVMDTFPDKLLDLREAWEKPMVVNSCCRCQKHNDSGGGKPASFHLFSQKALTGIDATCAIDIGTASMTPGERHDFVKLAMNKGWSIGVAKTFIHLDRRADYPETKWLNPIIFTY